jgi:hypothetical protein
VWTKSTHLASPTYTSLLCNITLHQHSVLSGLHYQQLILLFFSLWTELAVCKHKIIPLYMAVDCLVHSCNHMHHLLYICTHIYRSSYFGCTVYLCASCDAPNRDYFSILVQCLPLSVCSDDVTCQEVNGQI